MASQPAQPRRFLDLAEVAAHRVPRLRGGRLSLSTLRMPSSGGFTGSPRRSDVGVAPMTRQNRQQHGAKKMALARGIRAAQRQGAVRYPAIEQTRPVSGTR